MMRSERGEHSSAISRAVSRTELMRSSCGTTRFTRPIRKASCASINRPEKSRSQALCMPMRRGSNHAVPCSATSPRRANTRPEARAIRRDAKVVVEGVREPGAGGNAVHGGDHRLVEPERIAVLTPECLGLSYSLYYD